MSKGLGRGLEELFGGDIELEKDDRLLDIEVDKIKANKNQPRYKFDQDSIEELAQSIKENGLLSPIVVSPEKDGYSIIAGERRYRAVKHLGLDKISAIVKTVGEEESARLALIENIQREDLNIIEEARGFENLIENFKLSQAQLAQIIGKSRPYISNTMRLLKLDDEIIKAIEDMELSPGHGKLLLSLDKKEDQLAYARLAIEKDMSVRELEKLIKSKKSKGKKKKKELEKDPQIREVEEKLMNYFGSKVEIVEGKKGGSIVIEYYSHDDINRILDKIEE